jgi:hypothetical protein
MYVLVQFYLVSFKETQDIFPSLVTTFVFAFLGTVELSALNYPKSRFIVLFIKYLRKRFKKYNL